jgi:hypothetical protein
MLLLNGPVLVKYLFFSASLLMTSTIIYEVGNREWMVSSMFKLSIHYWSSQDVVLSLAFTGSDLFFLFLVFLIVVIIVIHVAFAIYVHFFILVLIIIVVILIIALLIVIPIITLIF